LLRKTAFLSHLYIKTIILPRQARDKHRENSKKDAVFSTSVDLPEALDIVALRLDEIELGQPIIWHLCETPLFFGVLSYVCPEPVLVK
jgi:hypothetical protein